MKNPETVRRANSPEKSAKLSALERKRRSRMSAAEKKAEADRLRALRPMDNPETRARMAETNKQRMLAEWFDPVKATKRREMCQSEEFREKAARGGRTNKFWQTEEGRKLASERAKALWNNPKHRAHMSAARKKYLQDNPEAKVQFVHSGWNANRPTTLEQKAIEILRELPIHYVGDGSRWISTPEGRHLNPDFIAQGKKVVLVDGTYWHPPNQQQEETAAYNRAGYTVLRIQDTDLTCPERVFQAVKTFLDG